MHQLDFEEFLIACGFGEEAINAMRQSYAMRQSLSEEMHNRVMDLFRRYLLVGGMPDAVNTYLATHNIVKVREIQDKKGDRFNRYTEEFEYLISSGITLDVHAIANPKYPLKESVQKNLLKLYLNDVGMLTSQLYRNNLRPILGDERSINLGSVYENVVAQELKAHGHSLFYYDNRQRGEVDFLIDDYSQLSILPIEVKSGKDYMVHSALTKMLTTPDYHIQSGMVVSNEREVKQTGGILYMPIYYVMFVDSTGAADESVYF